jgi:hypothetical protein
VETRSYRKKLFLWSNSPNFWVSPCTFCLMLGWESYGLVAREYCVSVVWMQWCRKH